MGCFRITRRAELDLREIARFTVENWGVERMETYLREIDIRFAFLAESPNAGKACEEVRPGYRKFPQGSHVVFYRQLGEGLIEIVRVLHRRRDIDLDREL